MLFGRRFRAPGNQEWRGIHQYSHVVTRVKKFNTRINIYLFFLLACLALDLGLTFRLTFAEIFFTTSLSATDL